MSAIHQGAMPARQQQKVVTAKFIFIFFSASTAAAITPTADASGEEQLTNDRCQLVINEGKGSLNLPRFGFDFKAKKCTTFSYKGQGGNANQFKSEADCYNSCESSRP